VPGRDDVERLRQDLAFYLDQPGDPPVLDLPADDVRTWDGVSPHPDIPRRRLALLAALDAGARAPEGAERGAVVVACARSLMHRVLPPSLRASLRLELRPGAQLDPVALSRTLADWGYLAVHQVEEPGTFARRGDVLDVWAPGGAETGGGPLRLDFFDQEIEELRELLPASQRSGARRARATLIPAREAIISPEALARASAHMAEAVDRLGGGQATRRRVLAELKEGLWFPGAEDYLGALHPLVPFLSGWPAQAPIVLLDPVGVDGELERFQALYESRFEAIPVEQRPPVLPEARFVAASLVRTDLSRAVRVEPLAIDDAPDLQCQDNASLRASHGELAPVVARLYAMLDEGFTLALVCDGRSRAERLLALFEPHGIRPAEAPVGQFGPPGTVRLWLGDLRTGFQAPRERLAVITADEIFTVKERSRATKVPANLREAVLSSHTQLKQGDLVVHVRHGIGRFLRLRRLDQGEVAQDYAELEYRDGARMYLPVTRLDQLYPYRAAGDIQPRLDLLGGESWARRKQKVRDQVLAMAHEILEIHAMRQVAQGHAYEGEPESYRLFVEAFQWVETPGQQQAIDEVMADLAAPRPMDRLLVGDVGFGKTEVAMRAAMRVLLEGRQVAVLCPTTVLAFQHARTFRARFADTGARVELLSRFQSPAQARAIRAEVAQGTVDILIGTHTLLGHDLRFRELGLVVVDEESTRSTASACARRSASSA